MYEVTILELKNGNKFIKKYDSLYKLEKFKKKCQHSKKVKIISIMKIS